MYSDIVLSDIVNQLKFGYSIFRDRYKAVHGNSAGEKEAPSSARGACGPAARLQPQLVHLKL
jgi:hypothetical protein